MAVSTDLIDIATSIKLSLDSASEVIPSSANTAISENGISLLDVKNEIFLSYLQTLALRNLTILQSVGKLLNSSHHNDINGESIDSEGNELGRELTQQLIRNRVYLEKGIRPLEERLKYTIDKTIRAADEDERKGQGVQNSKSNTRSSKRKSKRNSDSESGSSSSSDDDDDRHAISSSLSHGPNPQAMSRFRQQTNDKSQSNNDTSSSSTVYKPPRLNPTSMPSLPTTTPLTQISSRNARTQAHNARSRTLDEYVSNELSSAPVAEPSVGSMIARGGRRQISERERAREAERREYEETHLIRLPKESKKEQKARGTNGLDRRGGFGGEEWTGLGEGVERINALTRGVKRKGEGVLEKSRKRVMTQDGGRLEGNEGGGGGRSGKGLFDKRKARLNKKLR